MINTSNSFVATETKGNRAQRRQKLRNLRDNRRNSSSTQKTRSSKSSPLKAFNTKLLTILKTPKQFQVSVRWLLILTVTVSLLAFYCMGGLSKSQMLTVFITKYTSQYMSIMHNKIDYCDQNVNLSEMFGKIYQRVLHQDVALRQLEMTMQNRTNARAIALVGSSGVGKSLTARLLREHFMWPENVQVFLWNTHMRDSTHKYQRVRAMIERMSSCGRNLLIIDNMTPCDHEFVEAINRLIMDVQTATPTKSDDDVDNFSRNATGHNDMTKKINSEVNDNIDVTILYIFNMNRMLSSDQYDEHFAQLQQLRDTTVINYRTFGRVELADCIRHELIAEEMVMAEDHFNDILLSTAVLESGCKTIRSKVLVAGEHKPKLGDKLLEERLGNLSPLNCDN